MVQPEAAAANKKVDTGADSWTETKKEEKLNESEIKKIGDVRYRPFTEEERLKEAQENDALAADLDNLQAVEMRKTKPAEEED